MGSKEGEGIFNRKLELPEKARIITIGGTPIDMLKHDVRIINKEGYTEIYIDGELYCKEYFPR